MYNWDVEYLKSLFEKYNNLAYTTHDVNLHLEYLNIANNIFDVLEAYDIMANASLFDDDSESIETIRFNDVIKNDRRIISTYSEYTELIRTFVNNLEGTIITKETSLPVFKTTQSGIVNLTTDFYHQFKGVFADYFDKLSQSFRRRLFFRAPNQSEEYGGNTYSIYGMNDIFIECIKANTIQDYISLIHESSHGITCTLNPNIMWDIEKYCLIEVDSLFFEMIGTEFASKKNGVESDGHKIKMDTFMDHLYSADIICSKIETYNALSEKDLKRRRVIANYYKKELGYDKVYIKDAMFSFIREYFNYVISYLIAIELYLIYLQSPSDALSLLHRIIMLKGLENDEYLIEIRKLGIEPGKNARLYYEILLQEREDLRNGKKLQYR